MSNNDYKHDVATGAAIAATGALIEVGVQIARYAMVPEYREAAKELYLDEANKRIDVEKGRYLVWK